MFTELPLIVTFGTSMVKSEPAILPPDINTFEIRAATLIGHGPQVMSAISMIGDDLALDAGIGVCGKNGQSVPVGVGQPSLKIDCLTVGGTA